MAGVSFHFSILHILLYHLSRLLHKFNPSATPSKILVSDENYILGSDFKVGVFGVRDMERKSEREFGRRVEAILLSPSSSTLITAFHDQSFSLSPLTNSPQQEPEVFDVVEGLFSEEQDRVSEMCGGVVVLLNEEGEMAGGLEVLTVLTLKGKVGILNIHSSSSPPSLQLLHVFELEGSPTLTHLSVGPAVVSFVKDEENIDQEIDKKEDEEEDQENIEEEKEEENIEPPKKKKRKGKKKKSNK